MTIWGIEGAVCPFGEKEDILLANQHNKVGVCLLLREGYAMQLVRVRRVW